MAVASQHGMSIALTQFANESNVNRRTPEVKTMYAIDTEPEQLAVERELWNEIDLPEELDHWAVEDFTDILTEPDVSPASMYAHIGS